jgi:hypothetical protein
MAIISVPSATQGRSYSIKISGDAPTASEQARINKYVADQDAANQALVSKYFGAPAQAAPEAPQKGGIAGLMTSLGDSVRSYDQGLSSAIEGLGTATGIDWLRDYGKFNAERDAAELAVTAPSRTRQEDVNSIGSAASFVGETIGESAVPMGTTILASTAAGAAFGSVFPGLGTGVGALVGTAVGVLSQVPFFYGQNRERQKQEDVTAGRPVEVNEGVALMAAAPQAAFEAISDEFIVGKFAKFIPKSVKDLVNSGGLFTRLVKGSVAGAFAEVPTEVGQQFLERYQAGLPLTDEAAMSEYAQAAIAAAAAGGTIGGISHVIQGDHTAIEKKRLEDLKKKQISDDSEFMTANSKIAEAFAAQNTADIQAANSQQSQDENTSATTPRLGLPAPTPGQASTVKAVPIVDPRSYTPDMRSAALKFATERPNFSRGELHQHLNEATKSNVPQQSIASLLNDMKNDGLLRQAGNKVKATKGAVQSRNRIDAMNATATQLEADAKALSDENDVLALHMRSAEQTGVDLAGNKADPSTIGRKIDQNTSLIGQSVSDAAKTREAMLREPENIATSPVERVGLPPGKKAVPLSQATPEAVAPRQEAIVQTMANNANARKQLEIKRKSLSGRKLSSMEQIALDDTNRKLDVLKAQQLELMTKHKSPEAAIQDAQNQEAADNAKAMEAQAQAAATEQARLQTMGVAQPATTMAPTFSVKAQNVFGSLRQYLNKMNLGNVRLAGENSLNFNEGLYDPQLRLMTLAMGIYDPKLSEDELFDRLARVMDHEAIHALKSLGKFSEAEWASLTRAASTMKYKTMRNGKLVERAYTYLDRAESMYSETIAREDWKNSTIALDLLSPQVLKVLRKAAAKSKVKLGETISLDAVADLIGEQTATQVAQIEFAAEEAVAEMFRDYVGGRVKFAGKPKLLFDRIKDFFRALIGASVKNGITDAQSILDSIKSGDVGARPETVAPQAAQPVAPPELQAAPTPPTARKSLLSGDGKTPVRKYGSLLKDDPNFGWRIENLAFSFESGMGVNYIRARTTNRVKPFQKNAGDAERTVDVADIWGVEEPYKIDPRRSDGGKLPLSSLDENMIPDLVPVFRDFLTGKIDAQETIKRIKNTDVGAADKSNETSGVRQSKMTVDEAYKARNDAYKVRASIMGSISNYFKGGLKPPTQAEMEAWIKQSDVRFQDVPKVQPKNIFSREFKLFFGKSKLVVTDQAGRNIPRRVFHGGFSGDIYEFDFSKIGPEELGFHLGTAEQANEFALGLAKKNAQDNGVMYPLYARLENPVRLKDKGSWSAEKIFSQMFEQKLITFDQYRKFINATMNGATNSQEKTRGILQSLGYDGVVYLNTYEGWSSEDGKKADAMAARLRVPVRKLIYSMSDSDIKKEFPSAQDSYIVLKPTQLKSAIGNNGEYSTLNKDIRYSTLVPKKGIENGNQTSTTEESGTGRSPEGVLGSAYTSTQEDRNAAGSRASKLPVTVDDLTNPNTDFKDFLKRPGWVIMSATDTLDDSQWRNDARRAQQLRDELNYKKIPFIEVYGEYEGKSDGVSFLTITELETARRIASSYNQDSVITTDGLTYIRNVPPTLSTGEVVFDEQARIQDGFTFIPDRNLTFSLILDGSTWPGTPVIPEGYETNGQRPQLPIKDGKVRLLHWSSEILTELDPKFAGKRKGPKANIIGAERNDQHKKVFFGINPRESGRQRGTGYIKENLGKNMHEAFVDPMQLYPWFQDPDGLWTGPTKIKELNQYERNDYEGRIIKAGYLGSYVTEDGSRHRDNGSYTPLGNVAKIYYPIKVDHVSRERQSRMAAKVKPVGVVPDKLKRLTVLDMMDPKTGIFIQRTGKKITVIDGIQELFNRRSDTVISPDDPEAVNLVADLIALEAQMAVLRNPGAIGWYGETLALAKRVAAMEYPEICPVNPYSGEKSNSYSPLHEHIWDLATAITSNGQAVIDNFTHAAEQYEYWKIHGRFKLIGHGKQATGIIAGLKFYNSMMDAGYSDEQVQKFLNEKMTVRDLKNHPVVQSLGLDIGSGESVDTEVYGSYVLGPKIGQGFYQNLRGNFSPLTMDLWFSRLFNRITGTPFATVSDETKLKNFERISRGANSPMITEYEKSLLDQAKAVTNIDIITPETTGPLAIAYNKIFQRDFTRAYNQEMKRLKSLGYDVKSEDTKNLAKAARPTKTELILAMGTASKNFQDTEQADPRNSSERTFMRNVIDRAQTKVLQATGLEINTADFQALLWYAEKQLYKAMNIREGRGGDNDYIDGSIHFLRQKGISDDQIERILPTSERDRLVSGTDSGRQDAGLLSGIEASDERQADSGNMVLSATPNGDSEAAVARNGGVGGRAKPKRGAEAVAEAKKQDPVRLSRMMAHSPASKPTPYTGPSDLMKHSESLRYAAVQGAVSRLIQRTVGKYFKIDPSIIDKKTANFFKKMQDDMIHVGKLYDNLRAKGISIPQEFDSYFQEQLSRDAAGAKKQEFQEGFLRKIVETAVNAKFDRTNIDSLERAVKSAIGTESYITEIVKKVGNESHAIANAYLYALHAKERNQRIREMSKGKDTKGSGMYDAEADAILNWKKTLPKNQQDALEAVDQLAQDIVWMTNDEYIQGGLIPHYQNNKAALDDGTEVDFPQYDNYVSLRGFTDPESNEDVSEGGGGGGNKFGQLGKPNRSHAGRDSYAGDILVNLGTQYEAAVDKAARNKVGLSMLELIENKTADMSAIAVVLKSTPLKKVVVNGTIRSVPDRDFTGDITDLPILPVRRNGKEILIGFHDLDIASAMKGPVGTTGPNAVLNGIHNITRLYANLLTSWNPAFVFGNLPRDIETAIFNAQQYNMKGSSSAIIKKVGPSIKAIWGEINKTGAGDPHLRMRYKQFYENGGQSVFNGMVNLSNSTKNVKGIINEVEGLASGNVLFKSKHFFTKTILGKVESANTAVENGTRLAFFDAMMNELEAQGVPTKIAAKRAAFAAKNLTTNFTKGGEFRNGLNTAYLFYNASLQGSMAMMNSLVRSKNARKMAASIVIMGFMMDMMNAAASDDEDKDGILDYDNFNENRLSHYMLIPDFTGTGTHISIPLAYGLNIFYNTGRTLSNFLRGAAGAKGTYTASEAAASTIGNAVSTLNPFGGNNMMSILSPTQTDLIVELMTNKDFKDQPIYKELSPFDQSKSRSNLYWSTTSPSAIWVSKFLNDTIGGGTDIIPGEIMGQRLDIQPDVIEHVLGFLTGGLGTFAGSTLDTATSTLPSVINGKWNADMIGKTPILNKFLTQTTEKDKAGDYYTNRDKVMVIQAEIKDAIASGDRDRIEAAKATYPERIKVMGRIGEIEKRLGKLRKMKKLVTESTKMPEDKRQKSLDNINQAINKLISIGNQIMGDAGI